MVKKGIVGKHPSLRDLDDGRVWSNAWQPTTTVAQSYEAIFTQARAEFRQRHVGLEIHTEICVSPEDDVELRRITITNRTAAARAIELTSYAEVVLWSSSMKTCRFTANPCRNKSPV